MVSMRTATPGKKSRMIKQLAGWHGECGRLDEKRLRPTGGGFFIFASDRSRFVKATRKVFSGVDPRQTLLADHRLLKSQTASEKTHEMRRSKGQQDLFLKAASCRIEGVPWTGSLSMHGFSRWIVFLFFLSCVVGSCHAVCVCFRVGRLIPARDNAVCQDLAKLYPPVIERMIRRSWALHEDLVLRERRSVFAQGFESFGGVHGSSKSGVWWRRWAFEGAMRHNCKVVTP